MDLAREKQRYQVALNLSGNKVRQNQRHARVASTPREGASPRDRSPQRRRSYRNFTWEWRQKSLRP